MSILLAFCGNVFILIYSFFSYKSTFRRVTALLAIFFFFLINTNLQVWSSNVIQSTFTLLGLLVVLVVNYKFIFPRFVIPWLCLLFLFSILGLINSYAYIFTLEKLFFFLVLVLAASTVVFECEYKREKATSVLTTSMLTVVYLSLLSVFFPSIGYEKTVGRDLLLFQGITNHPQSFGVFIAGVAGFYLYKINMRFNKMDLMHLMVSLTMLVMSKARTGMLAFVLIVLFIGLYRRGKPLKIFFIGLLKGKFPQVCFVLLLTLVLAVPSARKYIGGLMVKRSNIGTVSESFQNSRGLQVIQSVNNIKTNIWAGIGFALPSQKNKYYENVRYTSFGVQYGVNTEKGFLPLALLEETGVIGFVFFVFVLLFTLAHIDMNRPSSYFMLTLLLANMGEMFFFSPGGLGLLFWILFAFSWKREQ